MNKLSTRLYKGNGDGLQMRGRVRTTVSEYRRTAVGGPETARLEVRGSPHALRTFIVDALGGRCEIYNHLAKLVWHGRMTQIKARIGDVVVDASLDTARNRVRVRYYKVSISGDVGEQTDTDWQEDTVSSARFGRRELIQTLQRLSETDATAMRSKIVSQLAYPQVSAEGTRGVATAEVFCRGYFPSLNDQYYTHTSGLEKFDEQMNFGHNFGEGSGITTVAQRVSLDPAVSAYTATTISLFLMKVGNPTDSVRVRIRRGGWGFCTYHNGVVPWGHNISIDDTYLRVGDYICLDTWPVDAVANAVHDGSWRGWNLWRDHGYIGNNTPVMVTAPEGTTTLATVTKPASEISSNQLTEYTLTFDTPFSFSPSTARSAAWSDDANVQTVFITSSSEYWIEVTRTGGNDGGNFFAVGFSAQAAYPRGESRIRVSTPYNSYGYYWRPTVPDPASMIFKLWGYQSSEQIIADMAASSQWLRGVIVATPSGQSLAQYRSGTNTILTELEGVLKQGVLNGRRYIADVTHDRYLSVVQEPLPTTMQPYRLTKGNTELWQGGRRVRKDECVAGVYAVVEDAELYDAHFADSGLMFIEEASYNAETDAYTPRGRARPSMFDIAAVTQG